MSTTYRIDRSPNLTATVIKVGVGQVTGPRGITANTLFVVRHDTNANAARPLDADTVLWVGSVEPANAVLATDMWVDTT